MGVIVHTVVRMIAAMIVPMVMRMGLPVRKIVHLHNRHAVDPFLAIAATANAANGFGSLV